MARDFELSANDKRFLRALRITSWDEDGELDKPPKQLPQRCESDDKSPNPKRDAA